MRRLVVAALAFCALQLSAQQREPSPSAAQILAQARTLAAAHQLEQANQALSSLVESDPENLQALLELGKVETMQGLNDDALKSFEAVLAKQPDSKPAQEGEVKAAIAAALVERGMAQNDNALIDLARARKFVPDSPELLKDFGIQAESMRIYADADAALEKAHQLAPSDPVILYALAHVQTDEQKTSEAETNLRAYLKMRPNDASAHYGLALVLHMLTRNDEAKAELERSIALQPAQSESYYLLGQIAQELHQDSEAMADYEKVLAVAPAHGGALAEMGMLSYRAKDYATAEKYLKQATLYAPDYAAAHQYYAILLAKLGRQEESDRELARARTLREQQLTLSHGYTVKIQPQAAP
jgi:tetratricopeptide (TPR) repeat protein